MREILIKAQLNKFAKFAEFAQEFNLGERDLVLTNEFIYTPFMKPLNLNCQFVFQERFGGGEPSEEMITHIFAATNPEAYDRVVMVGGGAILDIGKLLAVRRNGTVHELFFRETELIVDKEMIAVPTTCGTGSEITNISVAIVHDKNGNTTKLGLVSDLLIPQSVCLIPELLRTLPYAPFAASAIDALIHGVESYLSPTRATMTSELFGSKSIQLILQGFKQIDENGQDSRMEYLDEYLTAATYAGIAFLQAGCATVHALSFPLGGTYHVPHGEANYALFGKVLEKYDELQPNGKIKELKQLVAGVLGCEEAEALVQMAQLLQKILPLKPLHEYGFTAEDITIFTDSVIANQQRLVTNSYVPLTRELMMQIYRECY